MPFPKSLTSRVHCLQFRQLDVTLPSTQISLYKRYLEYRQTGHSIQLEVHDITYCLMFNLKLWGIFPTIAET